MTYLSISRRYDPDRFLWLTTTDEFRDQLHFGIIEWITGRVRIDTQGVHGTLVASGIRRSRIGRIGQETVDRVCDDMSEVVKVLKRKQTVILARGMLTSKGTSGSDHLLAR